MQAGSYDQLRGAKMIDANGERIDKVEEIYLDRDSAQASGHWSTPACSGTKSTFVPPAGRAGDRRRASGAGRQGAGERRSHHRGGTRAVPGRGGRALPPLRDGLLRGAFRQRPAPGHPDQRWRLRHGRPRHERPDRRRRDDAVGGQLRVGTERTEAGRVRLRKYVDTEHVTETVPVTREEVRIEREPITDANVDAATAAAFSRGARGHAHRGTARGPERPSPWSACAWTRTRSPSRSESTRRSPGASRSTPTSRSRQRSAPTPAAPRRRRPSIQRRTRAEPRRPPYN